MTTQSQGSVDLRVNNGVAWVTFNRPESRNAMTWTMYNRLHELSLELNDDDDVRVVVFQGCGGDAFVAGTDIKQFAAFETDTDSIEYERRIDTIISAIEDLSKPTIALIEGFCVGGGAVIALACDFRYCTPSLKFGIPIANTLGNCLSISNVTRLIDIIGPSRTKALLMTARMTMADEALRIGLVNELYSADEISEQVEQQAQKFAERAPLTVKAAKEVVNRILEERRPPADASDDWIKTCYGSDDFKAAVNKFINKTPFQWTGK